MDKRQKSYIRTEEFKKAESEARKGSKNPMYGKKHSEETKLKMSIAGKNKHHNKASEETKKKMSMARKGKTSWKKGLHLEKYEWKDKNGCTHVMDKSNAKRCHPDWILIDLHTI